MMLPPRRERPSGGVTDTQPGKVPIRVSIQRVPQVPFAQIANAALRDSRLSFKARGILALVLSNTGEWEATANWIEKQSESDGKAAVQSALRELTDLGYRRVVVERSDNGQVRKVAEWFHEPIIRRSENPTIGETDHRESGGLLEHHLLEHHDLEDHKDLSAFDSFWSVYPRKAGKGQARKAWGKAIRRASVQVIVEGARRYAEDPNREPEFTAHPATWLNGDRWEDDPLPARGQRGTRDLQALMGRAAERDARRAVDGSYGVRELPAGDSTPDGFWVVTGGEGR